LLQKESIQLAHLKQISHGRARIKRETEKLHIRREAEARLPLNGGLL